MSFSQKFLCGVPSDECTGGKLITDQQLSKKAHSSREEARRCMSQYLIKHGFTRLDSRQYVNPENGAIRLMPKLSKFGGRLRRGKTEQKGTRAGRYQPRRGAGVVV